MYKWRCACFTRLHVIKQQKWDSSNSGSFLAIRFKKFLFSSLCTSASGSFNIVWILLYSRAVSSRCKVNKGQNSRMPANSTTFCNTVVMLTIKWNIKQLYSSLIDLCLEILKSTPTTWRVSRQGTGGERKIKTERSEREEHQKQNVS